MKLLSSSNDFVFSDAFMLLLISGASSLQTHFAL